MKYRLKPHNHIVDIFPWRPGIVTDKIKCLFGDLMGWWVVETQYAMTAYSPADFERYFEPTHLPCGHPVEALGQVNSEPAHCLWCGDIQDLHVVADHCSQAYCRLTNDLIGKPMTLPEVVFALAEDAELKRFEEWRRDMIEQEAADAANNEEAAFAVGFDRGMAAMQHYKDRLEEIEPEYKALKEAQKRFQDQADRLIQECRGDAEMRVDE